ncbi:hypothetical protein PTTG_09788 [Puccinia triticina 1-1 BBBD Race 1]|uniref:WD_REPEATS_REGION domain-containing protein n=1 Tax=Puccinia triticina (isolate 1-1 / race 1 (BBBD)) TaxID=630390 RepID=A0A180G4M2_PUCT1|nr:hypothetical protein PTTG_09788 [Puccinia triticina 1-1 BBBD Race 1]
MHNQQIITGPEPENEGLGQPLQGVAGGVLCVRFNTQLLLSDSSNSSLFVWDKASWSVVRELVDHAAGVLNLALSPTLFLSCSKDTSIKVWVCHDGSLLRTIAGHLGPVNALELSIQPLSTLIPGHITSSSSSLQAQSLLSASGDSSMKLWDTHSGQLIRTFEGHLTSLASLKLVKHNQQIIPGSNDETIKIWNLLSGQCLHTAHPPQPLRPPPIP